MFGAFFYLLRQRGLSVSINEWMLLLEGLEKGLHHSSLTGFYYLCRALLVKSEADFDRFDQVFAEFFKDVPYQEELPDELWKWLNQPSDDLQKTLEELQRVEFEGESFQEILKMLEERLKEQKEEHNGGSHWIGTQGKSPFGNGGWHPSGIRIGGKSQHRTAVSVAGERRFRDFRRDNTLDIRQFQMAFRMLRQMSAQSNSEEKELDVDATIHDTCDNAGTLKLHYRPPRKNTVKLLMLMDSGGSMEYYSNLCSMLFQAATQSNHFQELHIYYFHNCVYEHVYTHPSQRYQDQLPTEWVLNNYDGEYRVIFVGDAAMNEGELWGHRYDWRTRTFESETGYDWLQRFLHQYRHLVWLNPEPMPERLTFWTQTHLQLAEIVPMYELTMEGLETAMRRLMTR